MREAVPLMGTMLVLALAMATDWRWPPERDETGTVAERSLTPRRSNCSAALRRISRRLRKPRVPSRPEHDQRAVKARATLPRTRAREPRASMRACSYHASPGPGQVNVLWIGLWMISVNTLVNLSTAVDEGCCGKVDNRCDTGSCQVAGLPRSTGRYEVSTGEPAGRLIPAVGGREAVTAVSVAMTRSRCSLRSATTG